MHSSINVKARHSATYADYAALVIPKCAVHSIREIHTLILTVMILVYFAEGYMVHKYPPAITLKVKHIFYCICIVIFLFLLKVFVKMSLVLVMIYLYRISLLMLVFFFFVFLIIIIL